MKKFKKSALRLACLLVGLNTFTACYGPAPFPEDIPQPQDQVSVATDTAADTPEEAEDDEGKEETGNL